MDPANFLQLMQAYLKSNTGQAALQAGQQTAQSAGGSAPQGQTPTLPATTNAPGPMDFFNGMGKFFNQLGGAFQGGGGNPMMGNGGPATQPDPGMAGWFPGGQGATPAPGGGTGGVKLPPAPMPVPTFANPNVPMPPVRPAGLGQPATAPMPPVRPAGLGQPQPGLLGNGSGQSPFDQWLTVNGNAAMARQNPQLYGG